MRFWIFERGDARSREAWSRGLISRCNSFAGQRPAIIVVAVAKVGGITIPTNLYGSNDIFNSYDISCWLLGEMI